MPSLRVGHKQPSRPRPSLPARLMLSRAGEVLASPVGIMLAVPGLSALLGFTLMGFAEYALRGSNLDVARDRLREQAVLVSNDITAAVAQADPLLERFGELVRTHDPSASLGEFAPGLFDLMRARPGVAYMSASFPDGTLQGVYLDDADELRFQDSRIVDGVTHITRYRIEGRTLVEVSTHQGTYDPRMRGFYQTAVASTERVWTEPYTFWDSHVTGITRTEAIRVPSPKELALHAVLTVDFDVAALSSHLKSQQVQGVQAVLFDRTGVVLASSKWLGGRTNTEDRVITFADLDDPVAESFAKAIGSGTEFEDIREIQAGDVPYLAVVQPLRSLPALGWSIAYFAPESLFLKGLHRYERIGVMLSLSAVLLSIFLGYLFARHVTHARREIAVARSDAQRAEARARELGSYRLIEQLGKGGMGEVWRAEHRLLAREAAIKLILPGPSGNEAISEEMKLRFRLEAEALAALRSRNTIQVFDYGVTDDGTFFFVMELLDGVDLETLVIRHGPLPTGRVIALLVQACASLAEAHEAGLIHRDIKPANIFVCRAADEVDLVKVLDFGLVRVAAAAEIPSDAAAAEGEPVQSPSDSGPRLAALIDSKLTQAGGTMGTPGFMPPEQALGQPLDARADIYALGCVAYWLLTGAMVFDAMGAHGLIIATLQDDPDFSSFAKEVPPALTALIASCLSKSPEGRPADVRTLMSALKAIQVPPSAAWDEEKAQAFWLLHFPRRVPSIRPTPASSPTLGEARTLIVRNGDVGAAPGENVQGALGAPTTKRQRAL